jgi:Glycosyltransferase family 87
VHNDRRAAGRASFGTSSIELRQESLDLRQPELIPMANTRTTGPALNRWLVIWSIVTLAFVGVRIEQIWAMGGLFHWIGLDYAIYAATARVVTEIGWSHVYDLEAITEKLVPFSAYYGPMADTLISGPSPYPAVFVLPFIVTNLFGCLGGFAAWTLANTLVVVAVIRGLMRTARCREGGIYLATFVFAPLWYDIYMGQLAIAMTFGLYKSYGAFQVRREFRAGLWLGLLLLKPQFALVLAIVLVAKGRWTALGGLFLSALLLLVSTLALVGLEGSKGYFRILKEFSGFRQVPAIVFPKDMINFRGILANLLPVGCSETQGMVLLLVLSVLLIMSLAVVWRSPWEACSNRFPRQVLATMIAAMFTGFHNHIHGATLLIVPALAVIARDRSRDPLSFLFTMCLFLPTWVFSAAFTPRFAGWALMFLMACAYVLIFTEALRQTGLWSGQQSITNRPGGFDCAASICVGCNGDSAFDEAVYASTNCR